MPTSFPMKFCLLLGAVLMTAIAIVGLTIRARRKRFRISLDALAMVVVYVGTMMLLARS